MRLWKLAALPAVLALALGCNSDKGEKPPTKAAKPADKAEAAKRPQTGGNLRLPSNEPRYLNPVLATRFNRAIPMIFEGLVGLGPNLEPEAALAQAWDTSKDGKTITFRLRKDVKWHDDKPFTSKDVIFTFEAMRATKRPTVWKAYFTGVESIEAPDDHTVVVNYKEPYAPALVTWTMGIIPEHVYKGGDLKDSKGNTEPVGTGPFKLSRYEAGQRLILVANQKHWRARPRLDSLELVFKTGNPIDDLESGTLHFAQIENVEDWTSRAQLPEFRERFELTNVVESKFRTIAWNTQRKPFDDKRVRMALTLALDRDGIIDNVFKGQAQPLSAPYFPNMFGIDRSIAPHPFDLAKASKLLEEAGLAAADEGADRLTIELIVLESLRGPNSDEMLGIFRKDLGAIGVALKVRFITTKEFFERVVLRDFDAAYFGWLPDIPDPDPYSLLHSSQIGGGQNFAGFSSVRVDEMLDEARRTPNRDERKKIYQKIHKLLHQELPYTPLYAPFGHYAWSRQVRAVNPTDVGPQSTLPGIAKWWLTGTP